MSEDVQTPENDQENVTPGEGEEQTPGGDEATPSEDGGSDEGADTGDDAGDEDEGEE